MPVPFIQITRHCYADAIGAAGPDRDALASDLERVNRRLDALRAALGDDPHYDCLAAATWDDLAALEPVAAAMRSFDHVILIGIGGSGLGAKALTAIARDGVTRLHILDNLHPGRVEALMEALDARRTGLLIVSKSGSTAEVLSQALLCLPALSAAVGRDQLGKHVLGIAVDGDSPLRRLSADWGFPMLDHPPSVAGRYSVLTLVGMLPALILGLDAQAIRDGAVSVLNESNAAAEGAALMAAFARSGRPIAVHLAYDQRLEVFTRWHAQLWAESLGKDGLGMTPVPALGPVDQHSQLQLYLDGPADKAFTMYVAESEGVGTRISADVIGGSDALSYLSGRTIGDIIAASARATAETLVAHRRPVRLMMLPRIDESVLGGLFMHFMLETILTADLLGVDPFDQPAVDEGKVRAREYLRTGRVALEP